MGGTGYSIDKGKTLVDGTGYEVPFVENVQLRLEFTAGKDNDRYRYVEVNGSKYYTGTITLDVPVGTSVYIYNQTGDRHTTYLDYDDEECNYYPKIYDRINGITLDYEFGYTFAITVSANIFWKFEDRAPYQCYCNVNIIPI